LAVQERDIKFRNRKKENIIKEKRRRKNSETGNYNRRNENNDTK
jgi:hypothetical protein